MKKCLVILFYFLLAVSANAVTLTVTNCSSSVLVTGSLPWAANQANSELEQVTIDFHIPTTEAGYTTMEGASYWRIPLLAPVIISHNTVFIHGSSQSSFEGNTNPLGPEIEITSGTSEVLDALIKIVSCNDCSIEGLALNGSTGSGIKVSIGNRNRIIGNYIGTTVTGESAKANASYGIFLDGSTLTKIGGLGSGEGNIISYNSGSGIYFYRSTSNSAEANTISHNGQYGILADGLTSKYNAFYRNSLHSNSVAGIKLTNQANQNIAFPTIVTAEAYTVSNRTYVSGTSAGNAYIEIFQVETPEVLSAGEGKVFLGSTEADATGEWFTYLPLSYLGSKITATQTDTSFDTSEFSLNKGPIAMVQEYRPDALIGIISDESDYIGDNIINSSGFQQEKSQAFLAGQKATYFSNVKNTGSTSESIIVKGTAGDSSWEVKYFDAKSAGIDITSNVTQDGWASPIVATGEGVDIRIEVQSLVSDIITKKVYLTAISQNNSNKKDVVLATTATSLPAHALNSFLLTAPPSVDANIPFVLTVEAKDSSGNITTEVRNETALSVDVGVIAPVKIDAIQFTDDGVWSGSVTLSKAGTRRITAANGGVSNYTDLLVYNGTSEFSDSALGVTVVVPPGAVSSEVSISISEQSSLPGSPPSGKWQAGKIISLSSSVTDFISPITVTLPLYSGAKTAEPYFWNGSSWSQVGLSGTVLTDSSITFQSTHLTVFVPFDVSQSAQYIFGPSPYNPIKDGFASFWYWLTSEKPTSLFMFDMAGGLVLKKDFASGLNGARGGQNTVSWDGKNAFGEILDNGTYFYQVVQDGHRISKGKIIILR